MSTPTTRPTLTVLVPIYNERTTLMELLTRVLDSPVRKEVIVIDDASTDGTREILKNEVEARLQEVRVIYQEQNGGKGSAIRAGIPVARGDYIIIQDGDLEYDPMEYGKLIEPMERGATVVYGSRFMCGKPKMQLPNRIINWLLPQMVRYLYGARITDEATCYKLFRRDVLQGIPLQCRRFEFCPEVTAKVLRKGHKIVEVPITYEARSLAEGKKIRWTDGVSAIWTLLRYRFWR